MIIDIHAHLWFDDYPSKDFWQDFVSISASLSGKPAEKVRERLPGWWDHTGDLLVEDMDRANIDKSVILPIDYALMGGAAKDAISLEEVHNRYAKAAEKHPDRLIAFAGIDPRRAEAVKFLDSAVNNKGLRGIKLHPAVGFYPNEPCAYKIYQKCLELNIPVLIHTGPEVYPYYSKYAMPMFLDEVANDFPELRIVMAHAGGTYWQEAATIASNKLNLYVDLSWWQTQYLGLPEEEFYARIRELVNIAGRSRVLFGSDWPAMRQVRRLDHAAWVMVFEEAPERAKKSGIKFTDEEIGAIMGDNAARLLDL